MKLKRMNYERQVLELSQEKSIEHLSGNVKKAAGTMELELRERSMSEV